MRRALVISAGFVLVAPVCLQHWIGMASASSPRVGSASSPTKNTGLPSAAVLELGSAPEHSDLAALMAEHLSTELENSGKARVLERRQVAELLRQQAASGGGEVSDAQAAKLGKRAGASWLVTGRLSRMGSGFRVEVNLVDAASAKVLATASTRFSGRGAVELAAREVVAALLGEEKAPALDETRLLQAAEELSRRIGHRFPKARSRIISMSPSGWATLAGGFSRGLVSGLRMDVVRKDFVTGEREVRGYLLVRRSDHASASGPTRALGEPLGIGDEAIGRELLVKVSSSLPEVADAMTGSLAEITHFEIPAKGQVNLEIQVELSGSTAGARRLTATIHDREGHFLDRIEGMLRF